MQFTVDGRTYRLRFRHERFNPPVVYTQHGHKRDKDRLIQAQTTCFISVHTPGEDPKTAVVLGSAQAKCSVDDQFSPEEGRKKALFRAARKVFDASHTLRAAAWKAYRTRFERPSTLKPVACNLCGKDMGFIAGKAQEAFCAECHDEVSAS